MNNAMNSPKIFCDVDDVGIGADRAIDGQDAKPGVSDTPRHFAVMIDGRTAGFIEYRVYGNTAIVTHTEIASRYGGQGLGSELASRALRFFTSQAWQVVPVCGFFARHLRTHSGQAAATPASRRIFNL